MKKVIVVGAGFSGMSLAYFLVQKGFAVTVIDKKDRAGGMISTPRTFSGVYETAANGFLNTPMVEKFLRDIQADYIGSSQESKKRYIFRGCPRRWPLSFFETLHLLWKVLLFIPRTKIDKMAAPRESVVGWADQNFTPAFTDYLLSPALQGIYAGDVQNLSASLVLNPIINRKQISRDQENIVRVDRAPVEKSGLSADIGSSSGLSSKSIAILQSSFSADSSLKTSVSPRPSASSLLSGLKGMEDLMLHLQNFLQEKGVTFQFNQEWNSDLQAKMEADHTVIATSVADAGTILSQMASDEARANALLLQKMEMTSLVTVTCFFEKPPQVGQGFGVLFPRSEKARALGVLMNTFIFKRDTKIHSETWIYGGALDPEVISLSDNQIKKIILEDRILALSDSQDILEIKITRWPKGLPHYTIEHEKLLTQLKPMQGVSLHGNYLGSLGLSRILEKSAHLADKIGNDLQ